MNARAARRCGMVAALEGLVVSARDPARSPGKTAIQELLTGPRKEPEVGFREGHQRRKVMKSMKTGDRGGGVVLTGALLMSV